MKLCTRCNTKKQVGLFNKDKSRKDGLSPYCKECRKSFASNKRGTLSYFKKHVWCQLNKRCINGTNVTYSKKNKSYIDNEIKLEMKKEQWYNYCDNKKDLIEYYYNNFQTPSIDRMDSTKHYSLDNIQIISLSENVKKMNKKI